VSPSLRQCLEPGCGRLVRASRCDLHAKRGWKGAGGMGSGWTKLRRKVLAEEPQCRSCGLPATTVDHITPRAFGGSNARANLQPLCSGCHKVKSQQEAHVGMRRRRAAG
jgi:5-methylcytosine-specific restriction enzyme A